jgi:hypothetical protein
MNSLRKSTTLFVIAITAILAHTVYAKTSEEILKEADISRGGGLPGLKWTIGVDSRLKPDKTEYFELQVLATSGDWLAEFALPKNSQGNKLLRRGENMWFSQKSLRKPVPISQRQRLTGGAANGDIASTNYVRDYVATRLADEAIDGQATYVFDLKANGTSVSYDKIRYWVDQASGLGVRAEFYTLAGRLLKSASFEYGNSIVIDNLKRPFISKMVIQDEVNRNVRSVLSYSDIVIKPISDSELRI